MRALIVDDHLLPPQTVGGLLSQLCALELQAVCGSAAQALLLLEQSCPDLMIVDLNLPGERWESVVEAYLKRCDQGRFIVLSGVAEGFSAPAWCQRALLAVVDKSQSWSALITVVHQWLRSQGGGCRLHDAMPALAIGELSPREQRVFACLGQGMLNREMAQQLQLSLATVESYRKGSCSKLGVSGSELVRLAVLRSVLPEAQVGTPQTRTRGGLQAAAVLLADQRRCGQPQAKAIGLAGVQLQCLQLQRRQPRPAVGHAQLESARTALHCDRQPPLLGRRALQRLGGVAQQVVAENTELAWVAFDPQRRAETLDLQRYAAAAQLSPVPIQAGLHHGAQIQGFAAAGVDTAQQSPHRLQRGVDGFGGLQQGVQPTHQFGIGLAAWCLFLGAEQQAALQQQARQRLLQFVHHGRSLQAGLQSQLQLAAVTLQ
ncbi:MAG: response regulator transcription factor, partial [Cyanobacteria bacterium M_surface_9_m1_291]|nr:response regulator transcription factor [Cyanobacteria bacterium M_surface_9_m1_291]